MDAASGRVSDLVVAIDGPSGSGKSTVARSVARALGLRYVDTGAMYRALTWWVLEQGIAVEDTAAVAALARDLPLTLGESADTESVRVGAADVTTAIRTTRISEAVSAVATNLGVRTELVRRQQALVAAGGVVVEGRDITTVVAPDAPVRILLTADEGARLSRRARELHGRDDHDALAATRAQVVHRDARDSTVASFLSASAGVIEIDSSELSIDEVVDEVLAVVAEAVGASGGPLAG